MFGRKRIKELEESNEFLREKLKKCQQALTLSDEENYKYRRFFNQLFSSLSILNIKHFKVEKNLTGSSVTINFDYDDDIHYVYKLKLTATGYNGTFKREERKDGQARKD